MKSLLVLFLLFLLSTLQGGLVRAGSYLDSAHGSATDGVFRPVIGNTPPAGFGYSRGNCAHCHEQHASFSGSEPAPVTGAVPFALFSANFDSAQQNGPYGESDNFCFSCHNNGGSVQAVTNNDYSAAFGCAPVDTTSIMSTMNQLSYHNLYNVWDFSTGQFAWFKNDSNPCDSCHNPHLAKRNWTDPTDPTLSVMSKPTDHFNLWGTTETMGSVYNTRYEPPYCSPSLTDREPGASPDAVSGRDATPDYVGFCTECHNITDTLYSTSLGRNLLPIDWSNSGDKHGLLPMDGGLDIKPPFAAAGDYVLSCLNCHEPHGASNVMLIRRWVNGGALAGTIATYQTPDWTHLCKRCHLDDKDAEDAGLYPFTGQPDAWRYVHHWSIDAPYGGSLAGVPCSTCHPPGPPGPINCDQCHYHGAVIDITVGNNAGQTRRAF